VCSGRLHSALYLCLSSRSRYYLIHKLLCAVFYIATVVKILYLCLSSRSRYYLIHKLLCAVFYVATVVKIIDQLLIFHPAVPRGTNNTCHSLTQSNKVSRMAGFRANRQQLLALAVVSVLNNNVSKVSYCLRAGLGFEIILNFIAAFAVFIYYCSASELTSRFPFPGGCFGFARCTVGFYPAFLIGCMEIFYYMAGLTIIAIAIAIEICTSFPLLTKWKLFIIIGAYCLQYCICLSKKLFYPAVTVFAIYGVVINLAYVMGSIPYVDFSRWAYRVDVNSKYWNDYERSALVPIVNDDMLYDNSATTSSDIQHALFNPNPWIVLQAFGRCLSVYMQAEYANLAVDDAKNPRTDIPFALLGAAGILFIFCTLNPIIAASIEPGVETASQLQFPILPGTVDSGDLIECNYMWVIIYRSC
jgi:hypothetical protein